MIYYLDKNHVEFPDPHDADDDGLLAIGGDITHDWLMTGYGLGIFQWYAYEDKEEPYWWCPPERFVIFPDELHISHSMRQLLRSGKYRVTFDQDFERVMRGCGEVNGRNRENGRWLGEHLIGVYVDLHRRGIAHSVEVWQGDDFVGGLYGVEIGRTFCGESMCSFAPNASKVALSALADRLKERGNWLIECQLHTNHLQSMGGKFLPYDEFMTYVRG